MAYHYVIEYFCLLVMDTFGHGLVGGVEESRACIVKMILRYMITICEVLMQFYRSLMFTSLLACVS